MAGDPFHGPKSRIGRAKHHFERLVNAARAYVLSKPYSEVVEPYLDGTKDLHKVVLTRPIPDDLPATMLEIVEHLRAALDQAGYAAAVAGGKVSPRRAYFPIADSAAELERNVIGRGRCKDLPPDILALFRSFEPYDGGNESVWLVNRLANTTKHKTLVSAVMQADGEGIGYLIAQPENTTIAATLAWDGLKNEMVLGVTAAGAPFKYDLRVSLFIAFGPIDRIEGKEVLPRLRDMILEVERIVLRTELECRRIGLIP